MPTIPIADSTIDVDICIVGSGPAGALVASQLAHTGRSIAIIEAGTRIDIDEQRRRMDAGSAPFLIADNDPRLHVPISFQSATNWKYVQIKKVGGNSRIWGGACPRGLEGQFRMRTDHGVGDDWPITYNELEPYYCDAEEELGVSGDSDGAHQPWRSRPYPLPPVAHDYSSQQLARACFQLGYSWQTTPIARTTQPYRGRVACDYGNVNQCSCCPTSAKYRSDLHIDEAIARQNVTLLTETNAATLVLGETGRVRELVCYRPDRSVRSVRAGTYVLAGNALGNARLLLLARPHHGVGAATHSGAVGRYFMGHPVHEYHAQLETKVLAARSNFTVFSRHFEEGPHLRDTAGFRIFFLGSDQTATMHGLKLVEEGLYGAKFKQELRRRSGHGVRATIVTDCLPQRENGIELDPESLDHYGQPGLKVRYSYSAYEENGRQLGAQVMGRILDVLNATRVAAVDYDLAHQIGTTRMGTDPVTSVVDRNLRVHDIDNLYVAGASVFPTGLGPTNPTLTVAALSLRLANHLRQSVLQ